MEVQSKLSCVDLNNHRIEPGVHFVPGPDACTLCVCDSGSPKWCKAVLCSPPQNCKSFRVGNSCCDFICLDDTLGKPEPEHDFSAELGLRLIATAITAILSLSLLFFLLHRLRQRKIRGRQDRELTEEERSLGSIGYIAGSLGYLPEHHFEGTGAGYPLWKPTFYRGEAPPPYEEALAAARAEAALARVPGPSIASQMQSQHRTIPVNLATSGLLLGSTSPLPVETIIPPSEPPQSNGGEIVAEVVVGSGVASIEEKEDISNISTSSIGVVNSQINTTAAVVETKREGPTADESDDYRSECENCNMRQTPGYEEDLVTMTLHRRTGEQCDQHFYCRASLTLPTHPRKQLRCGSGMQEGVTMPCARENWFSSMPESSTSEEDEEEE
ncbi:unnamed protein product [Nezara viridula]|uniref:VWFC domain-containing protein n=1 Tax=Nezara viridula TaxID=85310 RepID=A0A9P0MJ87_NEZVI|nr:unnamed protein product [Nezara viridula]